MTGRRVVGLVRLRREGGADVRRGAHETFFDVEAPAFTGVTEIPTRMQAFALGMYIASRATDENAHERGRGREKVREERKREKSSVGNGKRTKGGNAARYSLEWRNICSRFPMQYKGRGLVHCRVLSALSALMKRRIEKHRDQRSCHSGVQIRN